MTFIEDVISSVLFLLPRGHGVLLNCLDRLYPDDEPRLTRVGPFPVMVNPRMRLERAMLFHHYERPMLRLAERVLRPGDTVVDAGAHIGWFSFHFLALVGRRGAVHGFEPVPELHTRLAAVAETARGMGYRISTKNAALGERRETAVMSVGRESNTGFNTLINGFSRESLRERFIEVPVIPLDDYLDEERVERARLVKIDVEGAEGMVLRGARRRLERRAFDYLMVEISPQADKVMERPRGETFRFLLEMGYRGWIIDRTGFRALPSSYDFWVANTFWASPEVDDVP